MKVSRIKGKGSKSKSVFISLHLPMFRLRSRLAKILVQVSQTESPTQLSGKVFINEAYCGVVRDPCPKAILRICFFSPLFMRAGKLTQMCFTMPRCAHVMACSPDKRMYNGVPLNHPYLVSDAEYGCVNVRLVYATPLGRAVLPKSDTALVDSGETEHRRNVPFV